MAYDLVLISVLLAAGYWGVFFARTRPHGTPTFGLMLLASAVLAGLGLIGRHASWDAPWLGVAGAIGVGAGACLLVIGPRVRALARRMVSEERLGLARRLLDVAELLAPGSGVDEEKAVLHAMTEIRAGRIEQTVEALTAAKERVPAAARLAIDERIAMLYVAAYRWRDAIAHAEAHLFGAPPPDEEPASLRGALGIAPPIWVELLGAYGRVGDLDRAARMVARLEDACAGRSDGALWIHRARMMFLALAGRIEAVRALLAPQQSSHMSNAARSYWLAVAHEHHGDRAEAVATYQRARALSRGRPRELIDEALARLGSATEGPAAPVRAEPAGVASDVIARIEAAPLPPQIRTSRASRPRMAWLLTVALLAVAVISDAALGETSDLGVLTRAGALVRSAIDAGEWWRVVSSIFVHIGGLHLAVNAIGLLLIGRIAEQLFGSARMVAVFAVSGVAGALASYLASSTGISAGASGAVFGLLGAVFVEITWHRQRYRAAWKRGLWGALAVATVGQLVLDFLYPMIDQWAHGGGLVAGALIGFLLSPSARWSRAGVHAGRAIALVFGGFVVAAAVLVARTPLAETIARGPRISRVVRGVRITVPASWHVEHDVVMQPDRILVVELGRAPLVDSEGRPIAPHRQLDNAVAVQRQAWKNAIGEPTPARERLVAVPDGWDGAELEATSEDDGMGHRQRWRLIVCGRVSGDSMVFISIVVPEGVASAAPAVLAELIASTGPA